MPADEHKTTGSYLNPTSLSFRLGVDVLVSQPQPACWSSFKSVTEVTKPSLQCVCLHMLSRLTGWHVLCAGTVDVVNQAHGPGCLLQDHEGWCIHQYARLVSSSI